MIQIRNAIVTLTVVLAISIVACSLWQKVLLPDIYYISSIILGVLLVVLMLSGQFQYKYLVHLILLVYLLKLTIYYLATRYSVLPFGDPYGDYGVVKSFMQKGFSSLINIDTRPIGFTLTWISRWPVLGVIGSIVSCVLGVDPFYMAMFLPIVISIGSFSFVYLLTDRLRIDLNLGSMTTVTSMFLWTSVPESLFEPGHFIRQNLGMLFIMIFFYLIYELISEPNDRRVAALTLLFGALLIVTHHYTSFVMVIYMLAFSAIVYIDRYLRHNYNVRSFLNVAIFLTVFLSFWWVTYSAVIWEKISSVLAYMVELLKGTERIILPELSRSYMPASLSNPWVLFLLTLRDIAVYVPAFIGFSFFLFKKAPISIKTQSFVLYTTGPFGFLFVLSFLISGKVWQVQGISRILTLFSPFVIFYSAIVYDKLRTKARNVALATILILIMSSSFVGLWGHRCVPANLYDPSVEDVGEHRMDSIRIRTFSNAYFDYKSVDNILADDTLPLLTILSPSEYGKIRSTASWVSDFNMSYRGKTVVFELRGLNLYSYYFFRNPVVSVKDAPERAIELRQFLEANCNLAYSDGDFKIWFFTETQNPTFSL